MELSGSKLICDIVATAVTASRRAAELIRNMKLGELKGTVETESQKLIISHLKNYYPKINFKSK